jgi:hypothetical protein
MTSSRPIIKTLAATILISFFSLWLATFFAPVNVNPQL